MLFAIGEFEFTTVLCWVPATWSDKGTWCIQVMVFLLLWHPIPLPAPSLVFILLYYQLLYSLWLLCYQLLPHVRIVWLHEKPPGLSRGKGGERLLMARQCFFHSPNAAVSRVRRGFWNKSGSLALGFCKHRNVLELHIVSASFSSVRCGILISLSLSLKQ